MINDESRRIDQSVDSPKHELELLWNIGIPHLRPGIEVSWFFVSPSEKDNVHLEGFTGVKVEHVPLRADEAKYFGLKERDEPYKVTYLFLYPNTPSEISPELDSWVELLSDKKDNKSINSQKLLSSISLSIFQKADADHPEYMAVELIDQKNQKKITDAVSAGKIPSDYLNEAVTSHPDREVSILIQHGTTNLEFLNGQQDRIVGSENEGEGSGDYLFYLLNQIDQSKISAIVDAGCASSSYLPSSEILLQSGIPYFAAQTELADTPSRRSQFDANSSVMLLDGVIYRFDWSKKNEAIKAKLQKMPRQKTQNRFGF